MGLFSHDAQDDVQVSATFPESNPFGLVVNGEKNPLSITLQNLGKKNYTLVSAAASYHDPNNHWALIKNSTTLKYNVPLVSGANFSAPFTMNSEFRPQEIGLTVWVNLAESGSSSKVVLPVTAFNQTVNVVEPASTWFDPQLIFMYLLITAALASGIYYAYNTFFAPPTKKSGKGGARKIKAVVPAEKGKQYPDVKPYEEDWIPKEHLKHRQTKLNKRSTGGAASSGGEEVTSGGDLTSGGETSGAEFKKTKKKGKKA